ncbi:hypothetical protein [Zavarzinella formosa]|uniref:hypothetical protein n=1 Tax=Zavarzinella formosa TaxID=360055 RepID=UPI0012FC57F4|nr:hypothetical protein [Zavarzinella formosa]
MPILTRLKVVSIVSGVTLALNSFGRMGPKREDQDCLTSKSEGFAGGRQGKQIGFRPKGALENSQGWKPLVNDGQKESTPTGWHNQQAPPRWGGKPQMAGFQGRRPPLAIFERPLGAKTNRQRMPEKLAASGGGELAHYQKK